MYEIFLKHTAHAHGRCGGIWTELIEVCRRKLALWGNACCAQRLDPSIRGTWSSLNLQSLDNGIGVLVRLGLAAEVTGDSLGGSASVL